MTNKAKDPPTSMHTNPYEDEATVVPPPPSAVERLQTLKARFDRIESRTYESGCYDHPYARDLREAIQAAFKT